MNICNKEVRVDGRLIRVARLVAEHYDEVADPHQMIKALKDEKADLFTFVQSLPDTQPNHTYPLEWDNLAAANISTFDHWWTKQINGKTRNMVRRAEKNGVLVRESAFDEEFVRGIKAVFDESPVRQGKAFWHYGKPLDAVRREQSTFAERSVFIGAYLEGSMIGFAKLVPNDRGTQAGLMQIVSMISQRDKAPSNALIAQAVRSCAERRIPYLFYSRFAFGKRRRDSLSDFKENNGLLRVELPRYHVPLSYKGELALRCNLHHQQAIDYLPESLQGLLRAARDAVATKPIFYRAAKHLRH